MDSREYVFIFAVNNLADVPQDFRASVQDYEFDTGIFLPQDDTNWSTRPPKYPARLLLLNRQYLYIVAHPAAHEHTVVLNLNELIQLEMGCILLLGWIDLVTPLAAHHLTYNTRASQPMEKFMAALRARWLGEPQGTDVTATKLFGPELDLKFSNLLQDSLDRNEVALSQFFTAPVACRNNFVAFRRVEWRPGHLLALTTGNRLLWLKDEYRGRRERYAGISVSVPTSLIRESRVEETADGDELTVNLLSGGSWRITSYEAGSGCAGFSQTLNDYVAATVSKSEANLPIQ